VTGEDELKNSFFEGFNERFQHVRIRVRKIKKSISYLKYTTISQRVQHGFVMQVPLNAFKFYLSHKENER
jgi:hypothetical protein